MQRFAMLVLLAVLSIDDVFANTIDSIYCNDCSIHDKKRQAEIWASSNTPRNGSTKQLHVIDLKNNNISTFNTSIVSRYQSYVYPYGYVHQPIANEIQTPSNIASSANELFMARSLFNTTVNNLIIPISVLPNAWAFTNCAYCANDIGDYIKNNSEAHTSWVQLTGLLRLFGISNGTVAERHTIKLESGGEIEIEIKLTDTSISVTIVKVRDADNNNVPEYSSQMQSGMTYRTSSAYFAHFDHYLLKLGFIGYRNQTTGIVTIQECRPQNSMPENSIPPCL